MGARPSELREELVNTNCGQELVHLNCSEGLVNTNSRRKPVHLSCSEGLVKVSNWAPGAMALVAF